MRKIISYQDFTKIVGEDTLKTIVECCRQGFKDSVDIINYGNQLGCPVEYEIRTKADIAHDQMKARFMQSLAGKPGIEIDKWNGIFALKFGDDAFCRLKKFLNGTPFVSVTLTPQQRRFNKQLSIESFPEDPTFITIGYYADKAWATLLGVYASCWSADGLEWFQKIGGEGFVQLRLYNDPQPTTPVVPRIIPKQGDLGKPKRVRGKKVPKKDTGTEGDSSSISKD